VLVVLVVDIDAANPNCTLECVLDLLLSASHPTPRRARTCRRRPLHNPLFRNELGVSQKHLENGVFQSLVRKGATAHHLKLQTFELYSEHRASLKVGYNFRP
jgi:hypothetical protein